MILAAFSSSERHCSERRRDRERGREEREVQKTSEKVTEHDWRQVWSRRGGVTNERERKKKDKEMRERR